METESENYLDRFEDRRMGRDRRDWDEFVLNDRRTGKDRRSGRERRKTQKPLIGPERRRLKNRNHSSNSDRKNAVTQEYYTLNEASRESGVSAEIIMSWLQRKIMDDASIARDRYGRRAFSRRDIELIRAIKRARENA